MGRSLRKLLGIASAVILTLAITASPVRATTLLPPETDTRVIQFNAYRNLLQPNDMLVIALATVHYLPGSIPTVPVTDAFIWRMYAMDNVTELGSTTGYVYNISTHQDNGYNYNVYSMYFDNTTALTWGLAYPIQLIGSPLYFTTVPVYNFHIGASDYSALTATADVQAELAVRILELANTLTNEWALTTTYSLIDASETSNHLSIYGEAFFRGAIFGIQGMAPAAFEYIVSPIVATARAWGNTYANALEAQWAGTWVETAITGGKTMFSSSYSIGTILLVMALCLLAFVGSLLVSTEIWLGILNVAILLNIFARLGLYVFLFYLLVCAVCWIYWSAKVWGILRP